MFKVWARSAVLRKILQCTAVEKAGVVDVIYRLYFTKNVEVAIDRNSYESFGIYHATLSHQTTHRSKPFQFSQRSLGGGMAI